MKLKLAYFGSPDFSARFLEKILTDNDLKKLISVEFVVTQPDKPAGRKQILTPTPVKQSAKKHSLEFFEIENLKTEDSLKIENLKLKIKTSDLCLVYAYSLIISKDLLDLPKYGFWCIHPSLLPKYRGTSPIATALINGEKETGVTIFKMDEKIDHGPIIAQEKIEILPQDMRPDLEKKLTDLAFNLFKKTILVKDSLCFQPQKYNLATYSKLLKKQDGFIDFENLKLKIKNSPEELYNLFRGLYPWPGIWTILPNGKRLKITGMNFNHQNSILNITYVQLEGKKQVDFNTFNKAYKVFS